MKSFQELIVWRKSVSLSILIYKITKKFPKEELYGLTSQLRRCSVSIPSNIAEGQRRGTTKDFVSFLRISYGSVAELETQLLIAKEIGYLAKTDYAESMSYLTEIGKMLNKLIKQLTTTHYPLITNH